MDRYRIYAIAKLLTGFPLNDLQYASAVGELRRKCRIYSNGCRKYRKRREAERYSALPKKFTPMETTV